MAPVRMAPARSTSSLQRLLALEKSSDPFETQLQQAVDILGLDYDLVTYVSPDLGSLPKYKVFDGRVEWVLRWLLGKLRVEEPLGREARLKTDSWQLLLYLIPLTPLGVVARLLHQHGFLSILQLALRDLLLVAHRMAQLTCESPIQKDVPSVSDINRGVRDAANEAAKKHSRKRKRDGGPVSSEPWYMETKIQADALYVLIGLIGQSINLIEALSRPVDDQANSAACQQLKSAIRASTEQASKLLGLWIEAMILLITQGAQSLGTEISADRKHISLGPMLHIWESRASVTGDDLITVSRCFTSESLLPATQLLTLLLDNPNNAPLDKLDEGPRSTVLALEQLLARHVFIPSRVSFFDARRSQRFSSSHEKATVPLDLLKELLQPVMKKINDIAKGSLHPLGGRDVEAWRRVGVSRLFDIALRCSSRSSTKRRLDEAPWINGLYHVFTEVLRCPENDAQHPDAGRDSAYLEQILRIVIAQKVVPASELLKATLIRDSNLTASNDAAVEWIIVSQILKLDANLFIPSKGGLKQDSQTDALGASHLKPQSLFQKLTTSCWTFLLANELDSSSTASPAKGTDFSSRDYDFVRTELVRPLIAAFAKARQLRVFIELWREQLKEVYDQRMCLSGPLSARAFGSAISVWEDEELGLALGNIMESSFTANQIADILDLLVESLGSAECLNYTTTAAAASYADMIVLDALLSAIHNDDTVLQLRPRLESLQSMILKSCEIAEFTNQIRTMPHVPRIFRVLHHLRDLLVPLEDAEARKSTLSVMVRDVLPVADKMLRGDFQGSTVNDFRTAYEAFRLITTAGGADEELEDHSTVGKLCASALSYIREGLADLLKTTQDAPDCNAREDLLPSWNGRPQSLHSQGTFLLAVASLLPGTPLVIINLEPDIRDPLLRLLCNLAALHFSRDQDPCLVAAHIEKPVSRPLTFTTVWEGLLETSQLLKNYDFLDKLLEISCAELELNEQNEDSTHDHVWILSPPFYRVLSIVNPNAILRRRREMILEKFMIMLQGARRLRAVTASTLGQHFRILIRLLSTPNAAADILRQYPALGSNTSETQCMDFGFLSNIAWHLTFNIVIEQGSWILFQEVVKVILGHILLSKHQGRSRDYLTSFIDCMHVRVSEITFDIPRDSVSLLQTSFQVLSERAESLEVKEVFQESVNMYFRHLGFEIRRVLERSQSDQESLSGCPGDLQNLNDWAKGVLDSLATPTFDPRTTSIPLDFIHLDIRDRQGLLKAFNDSIKSLDQAKKANLMRELLQEDVTSTPTAQELSLLTIIISNIHAPSTNTSEAERYFFSLGPRLCATTARCTNVACLGGLLHCVNTILRDKQWLVTQLCVDTVLSSIVATASPAGPSIPQEYTGPVFSGLCDLMSSLLLLHRAKLGGRFHLVVAVLQTLLRCVFLPSTRHASRSLFSKQPSSLSPKEVSQAVKHVSAYTRLLTTLCDPTVSSVRASRRNQAAKHAALTDDTKRAKSYAGQYVQYVIMEFCQCQLRAGLRPDVKEALMPGVYAMMDVVTPEVMRAVSAGMDATGRVMFKTLYDDWKGRAR